MNVKPELTVPEAAALVHRSKAHIYRLIANGTLKPGENSEGMTLQSAQVLEHFSKTRRGRPPRATEQNG